MHILWRVPKRFVRERLRDARCRRPLTAERHGKRNQIPAVVIGIKLSGKGNHISGAVLVCRVRGGNEVQRIRAASDSGAVEFRGYELLKELYAFFVGRATVRPVRLLGYARVIRAEKLARSRRLDICYRALVRAGNR